MAGPKEAHAACTVQVASCATPGSSKNLEIMDAARAAANIDRSYFPPGVTISRVMGGSEWSVLY